MTQKRILNILLAMSSSVSETQIVRPPQTCYCCAKTCAVAKTAGRVSAYFFSAPLLAVFTIACTPCLCVFCYSEDPGEPPVIDPCKTIITAMIQLNKGFYKYLEPCNCSCEIKAKPLKLEEKQPLTSVQIV